MKRSAPPRRTAVKRSAKPIASDPEKWKATQRRSKRPRPVSDKRAASRDERRLAVEAVLRRDGGCIARWLWPEVQCWGPLDGHEPLPRSRGGDPLNPDEIICLCRAHHDAVHGSPLTAKARGLLR